MLVPLTLLLISEITGAKSVIFKTAILYFGCYLHFDPFIENGKTYTKYVGILHKENYIRNIRRKNNHQIWLKIKYSINKNRKHLFLHLGPFVSDGFPNGIKTKQKTLYKMIQWTFLSSLISNGPVVSKEGWNLKVYERWQSDDDKHKVMTKTHMTLWSQVN